MQSQRATSLGLTHSPSCCIIQCNATEIGTLLAALERKSGEDGPSPIDELTARGEIQRETICKEEIPKHLIKLKAIQVRASHHLGRANSLQILQQGGACTAGPCSCPRCSTYV